MAQACQVAAIPTKVADLVRSTMRSPGYGHPAHIEIATGYGPCRHCLRDFKVGQESRILFTYDPFYELKLHALPGPIFIHAEACARFEDSERFPQDLRSHRLTFAGYGAQRSLLCEKVVENGKVEATIDELLALPEVQFIHVRDTEAGCYDLRIERAL